MTRSGFVWSGREINQVGVAASLHGSRGSFCLSSISAVGSFLVDATVTSRRQNNGHICRTWSWLETPPRIFIPARHALTFGSIESIETENSAQMDRKYESLGRSDNHGQQDSAIVGSGGFKCCFLLGGRQIPHVEWAPLSSKAALALGARVFL